VCGVCRWVCVSVRVGVWVVCVGGCGGFVWVGVWVYVCGVCGCVCVSGWECVWMCVGVFVGWV
jgi:hypothetical protein